MVIDGKDSSEVWSGFRVARRAYVSLLEAEEVDGKVKITASHDGYQRLKGKVTHTRSILAEESKLNIFDKLKGRWESAEAMFHFHPSIKVERIDRYSAQLLLPNDQIILVTSNGEIIVSGGCWYPEFGRKVPNRNLKVIFSTSELNISFTLKGQDA